MLWWASASLRLGDVDRSRFSGRGWGLEMEVAMKREEDWLCRRQGSHLFVYLSIVPFSRFMPSLTHSLFSRWLTDTVWHTNTHTQACTYHHPYINWFTEKMRQTKDRNTPDFGISAVLAWPMLIPIIIYHFEFISKSKNIFFKFLHQIYYHLH